MKQCWLLAFGSEEKKKKKEKKRKKRKKKKKKKKKRKAKATFFVELKIISKDVMQQDEIIEGLLTLKLRIINGVVPLRFLEKVKIYLCLYFIMKLTLNPMKKEEKQKGVGTIPFHGGNVGVLVELFNLMKHKPNYTLLQGGLVRKKGNRYVYFVVGKKKYMICKDKRAVLGKLLYYLVRAQGPDDWVNMDFNEATQLMLYINKYFYLQLKPE